MNTRDISAFIAVVETGSIVQAAATLHLTQPGVTRRVQSLEQMLGVELLDRQSKPLRPSAAGMEVYERGRRLLLAEADLLASVRDNVEPSGELRLGMPPMLADLALTEPVDALRAAYPKLTLRIQGGWSPGLVSQLEQGSLDVAGIVYCESTPTPANMIAREFNRQRVKIVASPTLGLKTRICLKDLAVHRWVLSQNGCGMRSSLRQAMESRGLPFDVGVEAFGSELQLSLVSRGAGVGLTTPEALHNSRYREQLKELQLTDFSMEVVSWLVHRPLPPRLIAPTNLLFTMLRELAAHAPRD
ncbi:LysR family transcriptional regulator [Dyella sp.]|uniref:LysR family transcriptional regulator n=1 Tax=Dyella sp. TaxID=1869338 RepID=UPI002ED3799E